MKAATRMGDGKPRRRGFQSTPPVKAATASLLQSLGGDTISIHAAREGGDRQQGLKLPDSMISIHAAREGGDYHGGITRFRPDYFNPRRP